MTKQWHGGKGSKRRSTSDPKKYAEGYDAIFNKPCEECGMVKAHKMDCSTQYLHANKLLDVEMIFREIGWNVEYHKEEFRSNGPNTYTFTAPL